MQFSSALVVLTNKKYAEERKKRADKLASTVDVFNGETYVVHISEPISLMLTMWHLTGLPPSFNGGFQYTSIESSVLFAQTGVPGLPGNAENIERRAEHVHPRNTLSRLRL